MGHTEGTIDRLERRGRRVMSKAIGAHSTFKSELLKLEVVKNRKKQERKLREARKKFIRAGRKVNAYIEQAGGVTNAVHLPPEMVIDYLYASNNSFGNVRWVLRR